jgi:hypothetical protein
MDSDILKEAQEAFTECQERESHNHISYVKDVRFARLEEQWPTNDSIADPTIIADGTTRSVNDTFGDDARLTINKLAPIIRQVVNDARRNKPAISVRPQDSFADPETAEIMSGLIRNIESASDADVAYDTAVDNAVSGGFGYFRINTKYACDDNWEQDIVIERVIDPLTVHGDPYSTAADSSDWNVSFVTDRMPLDTFEKKYKGAQATGFELGNFPAEWVDGDEITVAEYWTRSEVRRKIVQLSDGRTISMDELKKEAENLYAAGIEPIGQPRDVMSYEVRQRILTGVEVVETVKWAGKYIPIVPVYGDEIVLKGKRYFRSMIHSAIDAQRMYNYWASKTTAVVALAPRTPYIGRKGAFNGDDNWERVNDSSIPYLEYDGPEAPQRQPFAGVPTGMMQEMMTAAEHIKAVTGMYDASLGARSNEISGVAIKARQQQGDNNSFHFIDNLSRAIRCGGRILLDLIPKVYNTERVVRILGEDEKERTVPLKQQVPVMDENGRPKVDGQGQAISRIYDLGAGKYDLVVKAGPSFGTMREEARAEIVEVIRSAPESASILGPMYLRNSDWPGADEAAAKLEAMTAGPQEGIAPEIKQQIDQGMQLIQQQGAEIAKLRRDAENKQVEQSQKDRELAIKEEELRIDAYRAETERGQIFQPSPSYSAAA